MPLTVFSYLTWFGRKMEFRIFKKPFSMDKTITVGQKWLVNELDLQFLIIRKCTRFQSNRLILSKVIVYTDRLQTDIQTTSQKPFFLTQGVSKRGNLMNYLNQKSEIYNLSKICKINNKQNSYNNIYYKYIHRRG